MMVRCIKCLEPVDSISTYKSYMYLDKYTRMEQYMICVSHKNTSIYYCQYVVSKEVLNRYPTMTERHYRYGNFAIKPFKPFSPVPENV